MEGKNSFTLYTNWKEIFDKFDFQLKGQLIDLILAYVNDLVPEDSDIEKYADDNGISAKVVGAFYGIQPVFKQDLKKWKNQREINVANGKLGGRPKKANETEKTHSVNSKAKKGVKVKVKVKDNILSNDNNNIVSKDTSPAVSEDTARQPFISLILNDKSYHKVYEEDVKHYKELYPNVNVEQELRNMCGWLESNPKNRKTPSGIKSFITRWLSKLQDKPNLANLNYNRNNLNIGKPTTQIEQVAEEKKTGFKFGVTI